SEDTTVIVLENDLYRRTAREKVDAALAAKHLIVLDHLESATVQRAEVVLPAATFAEGDGTLVNNEGRAQRFYQVMSDKLQFVAGSGGESPAHTQESWRWLRDTIEATGQEDAESWSNLDKIDRALASELPVFGPIMNIAPPSDFRIAGQ